MPDTPTPEAPKIYRSFTRPDGTVGWAEAGGLRHAEVKGRYVWRTREDGALGWVTWHFTKWGARRAARLYERTGKTKGIRP